MLTKIGKAGKLIFAGLAIAAGAVFVSAIKKAAEFELGMAKVKAITGANIEEFEELTEEARRLGLVTAQTMTDIAAGMEALGRAGFEADEIIAAMSGVVALAESQTMELGEAARITATTIRQMGLEAADADRVVNLLAATAASSNTTVESLAQSMKFFAPIAHAMGMSVEETVAAVGKLGDAGLTGGIATRALQTSLQGLAKPTAEAADMMDKLGISMFDAEGEFVGLDDAIGQIEEAFADLTQQQQLEALATIFGTGAVKQFANLLGVGSEELARYTEEITGTTKAYDQQAEMLETVTGQWKILKGSIELLLVTIGGPMLTAIQKFTTETLIPWVNRMTEAADGTSIFETAIKKIIAPFQWMIDNGQAVKKGLLAISIGIGAITILTNPLLAAAIAMAALVAALAGVEDHSVTRSLGGLGNQLEYVYGLIDKFDPQQVDDLIQAYRNAAVEAVWSIVQTAENGAEVLRAVEDGFRELEIAILELPVEERFDAWLVGTDLILALYPELESLRLKYEEVTSATDMTAESSELLNTTLDDARGAAAEAKRILEEYRASLTGTTDDTEDTAVAMSELVKEYNDLMIAYAAADEGSREQADALEALQKFYDSLAGSVETLGSYSKEANDEVLAMLVTLEAQGMITAEMLEAAEKAIEDKADAAAKAAKEEADAEKKRLQAIEDRKEAAEELRLAEHGLWEETQALITAYDESIEGGQRQADTLSRLQAIYDETTAKIELLGEQGIEASGDLLLIIDALKGIKTKGAPALSKGVQVMRDIWSGFVDFVGDTLGDLLQGMFDYYRDKERAAEDHADRMLGIEEDYAEDSKNLATDYGEDKTSAKLAFDRKMEDIELRFQRDMRDAEDLEGRERAIERYQEAIEDATISYNRRLEDLAKDYTDEIGDLADDREEAINDEVQNYEDSIVPFGEAMWALIGMALDAAKESLWIMSIQEGAKALAYGAAALIPGVGAWALPLAESHGAAAAVAAAEALALEAGKYFLGFDKGAVFNKPTMLPPHMVAEGGTEAYLPLNQSVFSKIGEGIVNALTPQQPMLAGAGDINIDMRGMNEGAVFNVRSDQDATLIAQAQYDLFKSRLRSDGVRI